MLPMKVSVPFPISRRLACLGLCLGALLGGGPLAADSAHTAERTIQKLAEGVYEIRHQDPLPGWVNGNTTVIIGTREVLVVDACNVAWEAKADIAQIRQWTNLPVRYLVNTHWHHDHSAGNRDYLEAFPGLAIIAHEETKRRLDATAPLVAPQIVKSAQQTRAALEQAIASGKGADGQPLPPARLERMRGTLERVAAVVADAESFAYQPPTLTFEHALTLDLGGRVVRVETLGRGNTGGDTIVHLPAEGIVVAGDLVVHPVPYTFGGYPSEWIATLERLAALDADVLVPGHGDVLRGDRYVLQLRDLMRAIVDQVGAALDGDPELTLDAVKKGVEVSALRDALLGGVQENAGFLDYAIASFVELAYHEAKLR